MTLLRRRACLLFAAMALLALGGATQASATTYTWLTNQWVDSAGVFGPRHTITAIELGTNSGLNGCVNALNDGGGWAGDTVCASGWWSHPYCGCVLRYPWAGDQANQGADPNVMTATEDY